MKKVLVILLALSLFGCKQEKKAPSEKLKVVTTTTMITDLLLEIGGDKIDLEGLMGTGVDPHLYKASENDLTKLFEADVIFYNGLHLEGKLEDIFEKMRTQQKTTVAITDILDKSTLIGSENFASNYDPHIWFDIEKWTQITSYVTKKLAALDAKNADYYAKNAQIYVTKLSELNASVMSRIMELSKEQRILVTAHDAFNYFGKAFDFQVVGLQGLSTVAEAGVQDMRELTQFIIDNKVKAIFVESSVPRRTIEALQAAVKAQNHEVKIGGTLYSDALGDLGTVEGTYIGMFKHNTNTIIDALK